MPGAAPGSFPRARRGRLKRALPHSGASARTVPKRPEDASTRPAADGAPPTPPQGPHSRAGDSRAMLPPGRLGAGRGRPGDRSALGQSSAPVGPGPAPRSLRARTAPAAALGPAPGSAYYLGNAPGTSPPPSWAPHSRALPPGAGAHPLHRKQRCPAAEAASARLPARFRSRRHFGLRGAAPFP